MRWRKLAETRSSTAEGALGICLLGLTIAGRNQPGGVVPKGPKRALWPGDKSGEPAHWLPLDFAC